MDKFTNNASQNCLNWGNVEGNLPFHIYLKNLLKLKDEQKMSSGKP